MKSTCKIAILESYALYSSGIKSLLTVSDDMEVIAEGVNVESLAGKLHNKAPDIILIDLLHCFNSGPSTVKKTRKHFPDVPLLLITRYEHSKSFPEYLAIGANGFVFIHEGPGKLLNSIRLLCDGKISIKNDDIGENVKNLLKDNPVLTEREINVLKLFCNGLTYKQIGEKLYISPRTVESHKKNILSKLKVSSTAEMIKYASRNKLLSE